MKIAIYGNSRQNAFLPQIADFLKLLDKNGVEIYMSGHFSDYLLKNDIPQNWIILHDFAGADIDRVISLGGDGTFLRAAQWVGRSQTPILGINTGHLGFLASYSLDETDELIKVILDPVVTVEPRMLLNVECPGMPGDFWPYALNEVAFMKSDTSSMLNVRTWIDGHYLADYLADGLIVATPTGSTAYNLSVGGPILDPTLRAMVLSPIAPHSLTMRPLVVRGDSEISAAVFSKAHNYRVSIDGRQFTMPCRIQGKTCDPQVKITRADVVVNIMRRPDSHFSEILRNKMLWGRATISLP